MASSSPQITLADAAALTPDSRDRLIDLVRAASILMVVLGHWTMAGLVTHGDGIRLRNVLEVATWAHPLTWVLQVMPLFFLAAGFTNALALRRPGADARAFVRGRVTRVLRPTMAFLPIWATLAVTLPLLGVAPALVDAASTAASMPLWFLAVYVLIALTAPLQYRLHRRHPWALTLGLAGASAGLDALRINDIAPAVGMLSFLAVFGFAQQIGFWYADGRLVRVPAAAWVAGALASVAALVVVTTAGPYPVSMIGLPGEAVSNMMPPSFCVVLVTCLQVSLLMLARPALLRALERDALWRSVIGVNVNVMTIFLWHLTAYFVTAGVIIIGGMPLPDLGTPAWWAAKVVWLLMAAALTALLVRVMSFAERTSGPPATSPGRFAILGALLAAVGLAIVAAAGLAKPFEPGGVAIAGMTFAPVWGVVTLIAGWALVRHPRR